MLQARYARWLQGPGFSGWLALSAGVLAVVAPTIARAAMNGMVMGCEYTPYLPFVLLSAILLRWWQAMGVVLAQVAAMGTLVHAMSGEHLTSACFTSATGTFLFGATVTISAVVVMRRVLAASQAGDAVEAGGVVVFSWKDNEVWASWYGSDWPIRLGTQEQVEYMMADFLAQGELGRRLTTPND